MKKFILTALIALIAGAFLGWYLHKPQLDIKEVHDTIHIEKPILVHDTLISYETIKIPVSVHDTTFLTQTITDHDTTYISVNIPIEQKFYKGSQYRAWVSGYHASLDSIDVFETHRVIKDNSVKFGGFLTATVAKDLSGDFGAYMSIPRASMDLKAGVHIQENHSGLFLSGTYYIPFNK